MTQAAPDLHLSSPKLNLAHVTHPAAHRMPVSETA